MTDAERYRKFSRWLIAILVVAASVLVIGHFGEIERFVELARNAHPVWLAVALGLQSCTYVSLALGWSSILRAAGHPRPLRRLLPVAISKLFADQALPGAGLGGNVVLIDRLSSLGVPRSVAVAVLLVSMVGFYAAYAVLAVLMLFTLWFHHRATPFLAGLVTLFLGVAMAIPSLALWLRHRGSQPLPSQLETIGVVRRLLMIIGEAPAELVRNRPLIWRVTLFNGLIFIADAATLAACLCALGQDFQPATAFIGLMAGSIAATLVPLPLGLGSFEASCIAMLTLLGVQIEPAVAGTVLLRGLTLWLPLLLGLFMVRQNSWRGA
jgi:glycosyltransferase 2 family protein